MASAMLTVVSRSVGCLLGLVCLLYYVHLSGGVCDMAEEAVGKHGKHVAVNDKSAKAMANWSENGLDGRVSRTKYVELLFHHCCGGRERSLTTEDVSPS